MGIIKSSNTKVCTWDHMIDDEERLITERHVVLESSQCRCGRAGFIHTQDYSISQWWPGYNQGIHQQDNGLSRPGRDYSFQSMAMSLACIKPMKVY